MAIPTDPVRAPILVGEHPLTGRIKLRTNIVGGIISGVCGRSVPNLQIQRPRIGPTPELVRPPPGWKTGTHARCQGYFTGLRHESRVPLEDINELVLPTVAMKQRGFAPGASSVRLTPKLASSNTSPSCRLLRPAMRLAKGSG